MAAVPLIQGRQLDHWIEAYGAKPWAWSHVDCCMALADWSIALGSEDPAVDLRGSYADEPQCHAVMAAAGGLVPFGQRLVRVGWRRAEMPSEGCVAVIGSATEATRQWGAIRHEGKWKVRMDEGFVAFTAAPLAIWDF
ncbi:DUF6950 family protein [Kumtagia ephedrae]|uniref:DUF6950 domain-containing protein n=1 Tax=Kumtagia ephedrae TaxID=2116701 RepID=A0A2P7SPZ1_9HYPH|nr:hypothetical protein [Mesorhizobium ephedrae]PSJ64511.1 hypothetical protein C7I84_06090 [Mesorhizobium ephedrae]